MRYLCDSTSCFLHWKGSPNQEDKTVSPGLRKSVRSWFPLLANSAVRSILMLDRAKWRVATEPRVAPGALRTVAARGWYTTRWRDARDNRAEIPANFLYW